MSGYVKTSQGPQKHLRPQSVNIRSLNNKAHHIHDLILEKSLDFLCLTETWQNQQEFITLNHATPPGYGYIQKPRSLGRGGGLAVIHRADILVKEIPMNTTSFECVHFMLTGSTQLQVVIQVDSLATHLATHHPYQTVDGMRDHRT